MGTRDQKEAEAVWLQRVEIVKQTNKLVVMVMALRPLHLTLLWDREILQGMTALEAKLQKQF